MKRTPQQLILSAALMSVWAQAAWTAEHRVILNFAQSRFEPSLLKIVPGDTVKFVPKVKSKKAEIHATLIPAGAYEWSNTNRKTFSVKLTQEGLYLYQSRKHAAKGMLGIVQVGQPDNLRQLRQIKLTQPAAGNKLKSLLAQIEPPGQPQPILAPVVAAPVKNEELWLPAQASPVEPSPPSATATSIAKAPKPEIAQVIVTTKPAANAPTDVTHTLPTVSVSSQKITEQRSYQATRTRVGRKLQDPHDVPQAVTTVNSALMEDQQVASLREALRNVPGLTFNAAEGGRAGDNMMLRSFYTFGDMYLDGIRDTAQYNRETFNLEQVDVLRGSAAMLFGRGQAGGVINQVSKVPLPSDKYKLTGSLGTENYREVTADLNKTLGEGRALRVNLMKRDEGSWRSNPATGAEPELHREGIAMSFAAGLGGKNEFVLSHILTKTRDNPDYGVSFDNTTRAPNTNFPAENFWGTDRNFDNSDTSITSGVWTHRFSPVSEVRTTLRRGDYQRSYWARTPSATIAPNANGVIINTNATTGAQTYNAGPTRAMNYETTTLQSDYNNRFNLLGMKHELLTGVEYLKEDSHRNTLLNLSGGNNALSDPPPSFQPYVESAALPVDFKGKSYGLYVQDTVEFVPTWKATVGARRDNLDATYSSATSPKLSYKEWSYRAALSWQPKESSHYYVSWSDSYSPTADLYQLTVTPLPPERSEVIELGAKWLLFDGDLALRGALYRAEKEWERNTDLESTAAVLTKKRRTNGLELDVAGRITQNWEVFAGVALMDAKILEVAENVNATTGAITSANPEYQGKRARNTPTYTFNLWTTYKFGDGWKIGGGMEAKGKRLGYNPSGAGAVPTLNGEFHPNTAPAYQRYDLMLAYEKQHWGVRLNVRNLTNKVWYDALYDNGAFTVPGTRRAFIITSELKF